MSHKEQNQYLFNCMPMFSVLSPLSVAVRQRFPTENWNQAPDSLDKNSFFTLQNKRVELSPGVLLFDSDIWKFKFSFTKVTQHWLWISSSYKPTKGIVFQNVLF